MEMEKWIDEYYKWIFGIIYNRIGSIEDTRDLTQDTFLTAHIKKDTLKDPERFRFWLKTIAINKSMSFLRRKAKINESTYINDINDFSNINNDNHDIESTLIYHELQERLINCVNKLPDDFRRVTVLGIMCGLTQKECSEILEVPVSTINNRLHKAKLLLKKERKHFMEKSIDLFESLLNEDCSKAKKVLRYLDEITEAINDKDFYRAEQILLKAPAVAGDNAEAHLHIAHRCNYCNTVENAWYHRKRESLFMLAEQEFKLAKKLNFEGYIDIDTGDAVPHYIHFNMMAEIYTNWGKFNKALEYAQKAVDLGMKNSFVKGDILMAEERYIDAINFYSDLLELNQKISDELFILSRISNCYKKLGEYDKELEYMMKEYNCIEKSNDLICISRNMVECEFYIARWYARFDDIPNMLEYLKRCISHNKEYKEWVRNDKIFQKYTKLIVAESLL